MNKKLQLIIFLSLAIIIIVLILNVPGVANFDRQITSAIFSFFYQYQIGWLTSFMRFVTDYAYLFVILIFAYNISAKRYSRAFRFVACVLIVYFIVAFLQNWLGRPRPFVTVDVIRYLTTNPELSFGLPSGHSTVAFFVATYFVEELRGRGLTHWLWQAAALFFAAFVAFTRVYLGVHYFLDVVAGMFLGLAFGILFTYLDNWLVARVKASNHKPKQPNTKSP